MPTATYLCIAKALALNHGEEDEDEADVVDCDGDVPVSEAKS